MGGLYDYIVFVLCNNNHEHLSARWVQNTYGVAEREKMEKSQTQHGEMRYDSKDRIKKVVAISWFHPFVVQDICWLAL